MFHTFASRKTQGMKKNYRNYRALASDILRGRWLIHNSGQSFAAAVSLAMDFLSKRTTAQEKEDIGAMLLDADGTDHIGDDSTEETSGLVCIIPVHGTLTKYDNCFGVSTMEIADIIDEYTEREDITGFVLDMDSGGGAVNSVLPLVHAIRRAQAAGKPVIAHVDFACSAAYWISTACDAIFMDNILSEVGSIGAYYQLVDDRHNLQTGEKIITVYAPQSTDKNLGYRNALEGDFKILESELSDTVTEFQNQVKANRPDLDAEAQGVMSGAVFVAPKAIEIGLADGMGELDDCVTNVFVRTHKF